jgi:sulfonate transport system substrate-binding protein
VGGLANSWAFKASARAAELKEIRVGYQKSGIFPAIRQRKTLEAAFNPQGIEVKWAEFAFGPPILEGIATGNLDYGYVGDAPMIFAQAAGAHIVYAAEGIVVPEESPIKTLADLKGKKIGMGKGSSAHSTVLAALENSGLTIKDIKPVFLPPADGAAAFARGSIDAWSIWDPYLALAQQGKVRTLAYAKDIHHPNDFFVANSDFTREHPALVNKLNDVLAEELIWARTHFDELASAIHEASGVDLAALKISVARGEYAAVPISEAIASQQQRVADRFYKAGFLPKQIAVRDVIWQWTPNS